MQNANYKKWIYFFFFSHRWVAVKEWQNKVRLERGEKRLSGWRVSVLT